MPKSSFVDFKAVKGVVRMDQVLEHFGLSDRFKKSGDGLSGPCPIHKGDNPTQFRVSLSKHLWNCFGSCKKGGNALDFIAKMEDVSIHAAALKAIEWFRLDREVMTAKPQDDKTPSTEVAKSDSNPPPKPAPQKAATTHAETETPNRPLKFHLEKLEKEHPYLVERGLTPQTIEEFGIGFCRKGIMVERIAIPVHNSEGTVVAYAGRFPGEPPADTAKYKLPQGFRKSSELFNIHRVLKEPPDRPLLIVPGFFDCMILHQHGCRKVVALMGASMSQIQEKLIRSHTDRHSRVIVIMAEDVAGRSARDEIAVRLAKFVFVKVHVFDREGQQAERLSSEEVEASLT